VVNRVKTAEVLVMVITSTEGQVIISISDAEKAEPLGSLQATSLYFGGVDNIYVIETPEVFQRL